MTTVSPEKIKSVLSKVREFFPPTPLGLSLLLSEKFGLELFIKWDNTLRTGSFKERGAISALSALTEQQKSLGVIAASAGNHAMALAYYAKKFNVQCKIVMPTWASLVKVSWSKQYGAQVELFGSNFQEAYEYASQEANKTGLKFISAYDDIDIVCGQGTMGLEILEQCANFDSVIIPIGGGGLISGVSSAIKSVRPEVKIIGVQSEWIVNQRNTLANGVKSSFLSTSIADGIGVKNIGKINRPIIENLVDEIVVVSEEEIASAIIMLLEVEKTVVEGAGSASIAALISGKIKSKIEKPVAVVCGSNIDLDLVYRLIMRDLHKRGRIVKIKTSVPDRPGTLSIITQILSINSANILEVIHDRSFAQTPGDVEIAIAFEARDKSHAQEILNIFNQQGLRYTLDN